MYVRMLIGANRNVIKTIFVLMNLWDIWSTCSTCSTCSLVILVILNTCRVRHVDCVTFCTSSLSLEVCNKGEEEERKYVRNYVRIVCKGGDHLKKAIFHIAFFCKMRSAKNSCHNSETSNLIMGEVPAVGSYCWKICFQGVPIRWPQMAPKKITNLRLLCDQKNRYQTIKQS